MQYIQCIFTVENITDLFRVTWDIYDLRIALKREFFETQIEMQD